MPFIVLPEQSALYNVPLFTGLTGAEIGRIHGRMRYKSFRKGDVILESGSTSKAVFLLHTGSVKICDDVISPFVNAPLQNPQSQKETVLNVVGPGTWLGEFNAIDGAGHSASAVALEKSNCFMLSVADFLELIQEIPLLQQNFSRHLVRVIRSKTAKICHLTQQNLAGNLAGNLLLLAGQHGKTDKDGHIVIPLPLTHALLAAMIGHSRESVTLTLKYFKSQNWITIQNPHTIIILNANALRKHCQLATTTL